MSLNIVWNYKSIFKTLEDNVEINVVFDALLNNRETMVVVLTRLKNFISIMEQEKVE